MHFGTKSYLKSTRNHTAKHAQSVFVFAVIVVVAVEKKMIF
jgi:hypothetical protein